MKKDPKAIGQQIITLVSELAALAGAQVDGALTQVRPPVSQKKVKAGPVGGIRSLIQDGKLDSPKSSAQVPEEKTPALLVRKGVKARDIFLVASAKR